MKKMLLFLALYCTVNNTSAQTLSYGILLGVNTSASTSKDGDSILNDRSTTFINKGNYVAPSFGAYAEYNFTEKWGLKTEVLFHTATLEPSDPSADGQLKINMLEISPNMKFDFGSEYRKGGYLIAGPRITLLNKITYEGAEMNEDFTKTLLGVQAGIGTRMLQYVDLAFKLNYDFTPFYKNSLITNNDFFLGANLNLGIDIERLINKK